MKISKLSIRRSFRASKAAKTNKISSTTQAFKHEFRVLTTEDVNKDRSNAYQYLTF